MSFYEEPPEQHQMALVSTDRYGIEEWYCPTCGRRFYLRMPPLEYKKTVIEKGNEHAVHKGLKVSISDPVIDTDYEAPFRSFMEKISDL